MRLLVPTLLCATCLSSCNVAGEWTGSCDELPVETELEESDETPGWAGTAWVDGEEFPAWGDRVSDRSHVVLVVGTPDHDRALMLRGVIDPGGFHGACGSLPYSLERTTTGGDVALCVLSLGFLCGSSKESEAQAASRMINAADAERLDGELLMLRPSPF